MSEESKTEVRNITTAEGLFEHFRYTPISFIDDVVNTINELIYQAANALGDFIKDESDELSIPYEDFEQVRNYLKCSQLYVQNSIRASYLLATVGRFCRINIHSNDQCT
jgi:hypothetical protein